MDSEETCNNVAPLSRNDILAIIKSCRRFSVKRIKVGSLEVDFSDTMNSFQTSEVPAIEPAADLLESKIGLGTQISEARFNNIEAELDQLAVTDPEAYEQAILDHEAAHGTSA